MRGDEEERRGWGEVGGGRGGMMIEEGGDNEKERERWEVGGGEMLLDWFEFIQVLRVEIT